MLKPARPNSPLPSNNELGWQHKLQVRWGRLCRWEYWPAWFFYIPIVFWIVLLGLRHRHFTLFTAANPGMDDGGVVGERKFPLLKALRTQRPNNTPEHLLLPKEHTAAERQQAAFAFIQGEYPVVLKPDIGQRGRGVLIARRPEQVQHYLAHTGVDVIVQRFVPGKEFGIFCYRRPSDGEIQIYSVTAKELMHVHGDGESTLAQLIWRHPRAWLMAPALFEQHAKHLQTILTKGDEFYLVDVGSHCRGAVFLNANRLISDALKQEIRQIVEALPGFHFGRLDLIAPSRKALQNAENLQVLEVNGVTAEAAHVYHPGAPLAAAYASFFTQWKLAFEIARKNRQQGAATVSPLRLLKLYREDLARHMDSESANQAARAQ